MIAIERIKRIGWFTWEVWWRIDDQCGGVILGSPRYIMWRLLMWMSPDDAPVGGQGEVMSDPQDNKREPLPSIRFCDIPVRRDATLCEPGEVWLEASDGMAVKVWPTGEIPAHE